MVELRFCSGRPPLVTHVSKSSPSTFYFIRKTIERVHLRIPLPYWTTRAPRRLTYLAIQEIYSLSMKTYNEIQSQLFLVFGDVYHLGKIPGTCFP